VGRTALTAITGLLLILPVACKGDAPVPSERENNRLDSASDLLDQAPNALGNVEERLPPASSGADANGPPAEANGPSKR